MPMRIHAHSMRKHSQPLLCQPTPPHHNDIQIALITPYYHILLRPFDIYIYIYIPMYIFDSLFLYLDGTQSTSNMLAHPSPLTMPHPSTHLSLYIYIYIHHYFRCTINTRRTYYTLTTWLKYIHIYITTLPLTITVYPLIYSVHSSYTYTDTPTFTCLNIFIYTYLNIYIYISQHACTRIPSYLDTPSTSCHIPCIYGYTYIYIYIYFICIYLSISLIYSYYSSASCILPTPCLYTALLLPCHTHPQHALYLVHITLYIYIYIYIYILPFPTLDHIYIYIYIYIPSYMTPTTRNTHHTPSR